MLHCEEACTIGSPGARVCVWGGTSHGTGSMWAMWDHLATAAAPRGCCRGGDRVDGSMWGDVRTSCQMRTMAILGNIAGECLFVSRCPARCAWKRQIGPKIGFPDNCSVARAVGTSQSQTFTSTTRNRPSSYRNCSRQALRSRALWPHPKRASGHAHPCYKPARRWRKKDSAKKESSSLGCATCKTLEPMKQHEPKGHGGVRKRRVLG